ncbi:MAG: HAD-IA family hydrolase [Desulfovibrio sp.]|nr:HAD-IA family hydrolase [Desulfovibrio sp.]
MHALGCDLDGTLLNTLADIGSACNAVLGRHGYPQHPLAAYATMVGNGFETLVRRALPQDRVPDACAMASLVNEARERYAAHMMEQTAPYPGIAASLRELSARGIALFVLSNKPAALTEALVAHYFVGIPFAQVIGAGDGIALKPDPAAILNILSSLGVVAQASAYLGDSDVDMRTALAAGAAAVGAAWGFRGQAELMASGCQICLQKGAELADLPAMLDW